MLDFCNFASLYIKDYLLLQNMEKKHYAIDPEIGEQLIEWGLRNRSEGMKGAWKSRRAQIRLVCSELLEVAKRFEKQDKDFFGNSYPPIIQSDFESDNQN